MTQQVKVSQNLATEMGIPIDFCGPIDYAIYDDAKMTSLVEAQGLLDHKLLDQSVTINLYDFTEKGEVFEEQFWLAVFETDFNRNEPKSIDRGFY